MGRTILNRPSISKKEVKEVMQFTGLRCHINGASYRKALIRGEQGQILVNESAFNLGTCESALKRAVSSHGGDIYRRLRESQRGIVIVSDRPPGSTHVRGSGLTKYGPSPLRPESGWDAASLEICDQRSRLINADQERYMKKFDDMLSTAKDPVDEMLLKWEVVQSKTGGGYDNSKIYDIYRTAFKFAEKQSHVPKFDPHTWDMIVASCLDLKQHFINQGMRTESLSPTPFYRVRADQNTDGMIGFPVFERGNLPFSVKIARAIKSVTNVNLQDYVGTMIHDEETGFQGKFRNQDAIAAMLDSMDVSLDTIFPIVTILARIQRHGYKIEDGKVVMKDGKARAVFPPDMVTGSIGAMVGDAWQKELMRAKIPDYPSLMNPEDRNAVLFDLVSRAKSKGYVCLSTDESQYDATLSNDVMATILDIVVRPFFKREFDPWIDATIVSLCFKALLFPQQALEAIEGDVTMLERASQIRTNILIPCLRGGLISGHKMTMSVGSMYGSVMCQRVLAYKRGYSTPPDLLTGVMAGDDNVTVVPRDAVDLSTAESAYSWLSAIYAELGMEVNPSKQIHIVHDDEPLTIFLQTAYHAGSNVRGEGSTARNLAAVSFAERFKNLNMPLQIIAQISVMNNAWSSRFVKEGITEWLSDDRYLTFLLQSQGSEAWKTLIEQAGGLNELLTLPEFGAFSFNVDTTKLKEGKVLPIIPIMVDVARSMPTVEMTDGRHLADGRDSSDDPEN